MRGRNRIQRGFRNQLSKPLVAQSACSAFNRVCWNVFGGCGGLWNAPRFGRGINAGFMERQPEPGAQIPAKLEVCVGFCAAQAMMQVRNVQHQTKFPASVHKSTQQRDGVCSA